MGFFSQAALAERVGNYRLGVAGLWIGSVQDLPIAFRRYAQMKREMSSAPNYCPKQAHSPQVLS